MRHLGLYNSATFSTVNGDVIGRALLAHGLAAKDVCVFLNDGDQKMVTPPKLDILVITAGDIRVTTGGRPLIGQGCRAGQVWCATREAVRLSTKHPALSRAPSILVFL